RLAARPAPGADGGGARSERRPPGAAADRGPGQPAADHLAPAGGRRPRPAARHAPPPQLRPLRRPVHRPLPEARQRARRPPGPLPARQGRGHPLPQPDRRYPPHGRRAGDRGEERAAVSGEDSGEVMKKIGVSVIMPIMEQRARRPHPVPSRNLHRIWLAGLGALAEARQEEGGDELFLKLVEKGEEVEARGDVESWELLRPEDRPAQLEIAETSRLVLACTQIIEGLVRQRHDTERLIEAMLPESPVPTPPAVLHARRNAAAREELSAEFGLLSSSEVAARAGSRAKNKAALANRW